MQLMNTLSPILLLSFAAKALSKHATNSTSTNVTVHVVKVGVNGSDTFSPSSVTAAVGDVVQFQFVGGNHSVVQSTFSSPCESLDATKNVTGFSSGFMPVNNSVHVNNSVPVFSVKVNSTTPIYAHCSQTGHCAKGMVVAINAGTKGTQTFKAFQALALLSGNTTTSAAKTSSAAKPSSTVKATSAFSSSAGVQAAASATTTTVSTAKGARSVVDMALVMLLAVSGAFFAL